MTARTTYRIHAIVSESEKSQERFQITQWEGVQQAADSGIVFSVSFVWKGIIVRRWPVRGKMEFYPRFRWFE